MSLPKLDAPIFSDAPHSSDHKFMKLVLSYLMKSILYRPTSKYLQAIRARKGFKDKMYVHFVHVVCRIISI